jgi:hypothetical protein
MDLTLRIGADFEKASEAFKDLASQSEETRNKIEKFSNSFQTQQVDKFIDKQKLLEVSLKGTRGEVASMQQASNNYQREIERLIKSGLDPESEAIKRLRIEHEKLKEKIKETNDAQESQTKMMKAAQGAAVALYAAIGAGIAGIAVATQKTAEMGDELAKSSRRIGVSVEALQELNYAAKQNNVGDLNTHLDKLNKTMGDVKSGTGTLTKYLQENDKQLLGQLKNVKSNEQAFMLLMDSISKAPDEFTKAKLATEYFGKAGKDLIVMAENGADGISALREEAKKYGVMTNEAAQQSELYMEAQTRLKTALTGVSTELTSKLLPSVTQSVNGIANFIASVDDWGKVLKIAGYALAGLTAGLTAFLVITKGAAAIKAVATAFRALNAAIAANPIGAIAVLITAVLIPALIYLFKNWDTVQTYISQGVARLEYGFKLFGSVIKEKLIVAFAVIKAAAATLVDFIYGNIIRGVGKMLEIMGKLPFVGEMFNRASQAVSGLGNAIGDVARESRNAISETIENAKTEQQQTAETLKQKLDAADETARARREQLEARKQSSNEEMELETETTNHEISESKRALEETKKNENEKTEIILQSLRERLESISLTENQVMNQQIEAVKSFMLSRAELETDNHAQQLEFLEQQKLELLEMYEEGSNERIAIEKAADEAILESKKKLFADERALLEMRLNAFTQFTSGIGALLEQGAEQNKGFAIMSKAIASAEAAINSYLAFTSALASVPYPYNLIAAGGVLAAGIASQVKILSTPIPSAETGGRFIVPNSVGVDSQIMRVNPGEQVDVTPRGMTGNSESFNFNFVMDGRVFAEITNKLAKAGELYTLELAGNL